MRNVVHAISSFETRPDARKSLSFFDFFQNYVLFLSRLRYSRRLHARFNSFYMQNVVYAFSSVERRPNTRKSQSFFDFLQNYVLFLSRLRYSRRLHARFTSFYMQNVVYAFSSVERRPSTRTSQSFVDFFQDYALFLSRLRYLRRLNAVFIAL